MLGSENVVKVLLKDMHLTFICSIKTAEVDLLFFRVSLNIFSCLIKDKLFLIVWILSSERTWRQELWSSEIGLFL